MSVRDDRDDRFFFVTQLFKLDVMSVLSFSLFFSLPLHKIVFSGERFGNKHFHSKVNGMIA